MKKFLFIVVIILGLVIGYNMNNNDSVEWTEYTVRSGDTLWDISHKYNPAEDKHKIIYEIEKQNNLSSEKNLEPGTKILIPVHK